MGFFKLVKTPIFERIKSCLFNFERNKYSLNGIGILFTVTQMPFVIQLVVLFWLTSHLFAWQNTFIVYIMF